MVKLLNSYFNNQKEEEEPGRESPGREQTETRLEELSLGTNTGA